MGGEKETAEVMGRAEQGIELRSYELMRLLIAMTLLLQGHLNDSCGRLFVSCVKNVAPSTETERKYIPRKIRPSFYSGKQCLQIYFVINSIILVVDSPALCDCDCGCA